jgi:hypothetical protein
VTRKRNDHISDVGSEALPSDRLWTIEEAARFFGTGTGWVRAHVPAVLLPGDGSRRQVRFRPETCREIAARCETKGAA